MKKLCVLLIALLLFSVAFVYAQEGDIEKYAESVGEGLLKFQELLIGAISFISLGAFGGGVVGFIEFLFIILAFMLIYSVMSFVPFVSDGFQFPIAIIISLLSFLYMDTENMGAMFLGSMGVVFTVILPVFILLAFTFRIYQKAYEGKGEKSPFYVEIFNLIFLVFFGVFFIRYSGSEVGVISVMRFWSGWILIGLGIAQTLLYKLLAGIISNARERYGEMKRDEEKIREEMKKIKRDAKEEVED